MSTNLLPESIKAIRQIESAIIENKLDLISKEHRGGRLTKKEIKQALVEYLKEEEKVTPAPGSYFDTLEVILIKNPKPPIWVVDYDLWVNNEQSDLTLSLELRQLNGTVKASIQDLHIL